MQRFRPYFRYLKPYRGLLIAALLCGIIYGAASGLGLPLMAKTVFPVIFREKTKDGQLPSKWDSKHLAEKLDLTNEQIATLDPLLERASQAYQRNRLEGDIIDRCLDQDFKAELNETQRAHYNTLVPSTPERGLWGLVKLAPKDDSLPARWKSEYLTKELSLTGEQLKQLQQLRERAITEHGWNRSQGGEIDKALEHDFRDVLTPQQHSAYDSMVGVTTWELIMISLWLPSVFLLRGLGGYLNRYLIQLVGTRVLEAIRLDLFSKLQILPLSFFQKNTTGDLLSRGLADTNQLQVTLTNTANEIITSPAALLGALGYVAWSAYTTNGVGLVLISLAIIPLSVLPIRYVGKKLIKRAGQIQAEYGAVTNRMAENLSAAKEVRSYNLEAREIERFALVSRTLITVQMKFAKYEKALTPLIEIISACGLSLTFLYAYKVQLDKDTFLALIVALYSCYEPIKKLGAINNDFKRGIGALDRLEEILNAPVMIENDPDAIPLPRARGDIAFENTSFFYKEGEPVLHNVSVNIPQGTVCALVGRSGAGKSTFANLVPRFFDPTKGGVTLDGHDLRTIKLADLRRNIAIVSQDPVLFNDTIYNNIHIARPEATQAEVHAAASNAFAHDFIQSFPDGYETLVGERGARLSGGQKQRLALARAFLRDAPILILDEATSALDSESEAYIQRALKKLMAGKTVLIIAHRFSTIRDATLILVFEHGRVVETGNHSSLHSSNTIYRNLYETQLAGVSDRD